MTMAATEINDQDSLQKYCAENHLDIVRIGDRPRPKLHAYHWKWEAIEPAVVAASKFVRLAEDANDTEGVVRRLVGRVNPRNPKGARTALSLSVQCVLPGEQAFTHRHSPAATRFIIRGNPGAFTTVDGEPFPLETGDFITTPHLTFHGHANESDDYVLWLDGLDIAYAGHGMGWHEELSTGFETIRHDRIDESARTLGGNLLPSAYKKITHPLGPQVKHLGAEHPPAFRYTWKQTEAAFATMKENEYEENPFDCYTVMYRNPVTGGPTFPTTANDMTMLVPGFKGRDHRHNCSVIYYAFRGQGVMVVDGERFEWSAGDFIELPPWATHRHENPFNEDGFLYGFADWPAQQALGAYYYEEM
jgi:gentisate 1,2-dioxygenase